jgi:hypothetical protein
MARRTAANRRLPRGRANAPPIFGGARDIVDIDACIQAEVARVAVGAVEHADLLQSIGARAFEAVGPLHEHCTARELLSTAYEVQGLVTHALAVLAGLQLYAGRMQALSAIRQAREDALASET